MQEILNQIEQEVTPLVGTGTVAQYIPALAEVDPHQFGIAVIDKRGEVFHAGNALKSFSIQSISKLFSLTMAIQIYDDSLWDKVGREPSGQAFNSLIQLELEHGVPRNPFINAGAIRVNDLLVSRLSTPKQRIKELLWGMSGNESIISNRRIANSEFKHSARNAAMAYLMKSFGNFENDVNIVLDNYFHACAIEMNCVDMAKCFSFLANQGVSVATGKKVVSQRQSKQLNALLVTSGLYDQAGDFAYKVGMPGKSGVGGGIVAVIPNECTVCVWSPALNKNGNSLAGSKALELFTSYLGKSIF